MGVIEAFDRDRARAFAVHSLLNAARDCLHLNVGAAGRDEEIVRDRTKVLNLDDNKVVSPLFERRFDCGEHLLE